MATVTASIVLHNTPAEQLDRVIACLVSAGICGDIFLIDNSPRALAHAARKRLGVSYVWSGENRGYGAAHNVALRRVLHSSDYHFVLNPDVYFEPHVLARLVEYMEQHADIGQLMPKIIYPDGAIQYLCKLIPTPGDLIVRRFLPGCFKSVARTRAETFELRFTGYDKVIDVPYLSGCFMLFRVSALRRIGLFDERFFMYPEDIDITRRMHAVFRTVYYPNFEVVHDHARASYKSKHMLWIHLTNTVRYFNKWGWWFDKERRRVNAAVLRKAREAAKE